MKLCARLLVGIVSVLIVGCATSAPIPVASQGETLITTKAGILIVQVKIKTHEMQIGKPSNGRPTEIESNCTYSKYPCSIVDRLDISVNGNPLFIPRSAFCDLADLTKAEIKEDKAGMTLILYGGDASESYIVKIEFDSIQVKRRTLSSLISQAQPLQETTYHIEVMN